MKRLSLLLAVVTAVAFTALVVRPARTEAAPTTTTVAVLLTTAGIVVAIVFIVKKQENPDADVNILPDDKAKTDGGQKGGYVQMQREEAWQLSSLFLEAHGADAAEGLSQGRGAFVSDLAQVLSIAPEHRTRFGDVLQRHQADLVELARTDRLTAPRAAQFFEHIGELMQGDDLLAADYARL